MRRVRRVRCRGMACGCVFGGLGGCAPWCVRSCVRSCVRRCVRRCVQPRGPACARNNQRAATTLQAICQPRADKAASLINGLQATLGFTRMSGASGNRIGRQASAADLYAVAGRKQRRFCCPRDPLYASHAALPAVAPRATIRSDHVGLKRGGAGGLRGCQGVSCRASSRRDVELFQLHVQGAFGDA